MTEQTKDPEVEHSTTCTVNDVIYNCRYFKVGDERVRIEVLNNAYNPASNEPCKWECVGTLFDMFVLHCMGDYDDKCKNYH